MLELKYAGPKPIILHTGIEFETSKEDKYVYLQFVLQLLKALNHSYFEDKTYIYEANNFRISNDRLKIELEKFCPNIDELMKKENHHIEDEIQHNIQRAHENKILSVEDKIVLENNISLMHDYIIQRSVNKSVYYCAIDALANLLKKDHIDHVIVPMYQRFIHVLHSVQGSLTKQKFPVDTKIDIYKNDKNELVAKLQVINLTTYNLA